MYAKLVELACDLDLIIHRERDALCLRTIAKGGVIEQKVAHGGPPVTDDGAADGTAKRWRPRGGNGQILPLSGGSCQTL
jgi:hypothetical protein